MTKFTNESGIYRVSLRVWISAIRLSLKFGIIHAMRL